MFEMRAIQATCVSILVVTNLVQCATSPTENAKDRRVSHLLLERRGGPFGVTGLISDVADLDKLSDARRKVEARFHLTRREVRGNKLVRKFKDASLYEHVDGTPIIDPAADGTWFAKMSLGTPPQEIEMDLDMLSSNFHILTTTSQSGSKFYDFFTETIEHSNDRPYPSCNMFSDLFHFPIINVSQRLSFAHCKPPKASHATLGRSGSTLGLAPSEHLSLTGAKPIFEQLKASSLVDKNLFSVMILSSHEGVLSLGGTAAVIVDSVVAEIRTGLDKLGNPELTSRTVKRDGLDAAGEDTSRQAKPGTDWVWNKVQGADGWWQILIQSIWIDGSRILKNQAAIIDLNSPFTLAPPLAANTLYSAIPGAINLPPPHDNMFAYPCLNPPNIALEFNGKKLSFMRSVRGTFGSWDGLVGGLFSLGRWEEGSGYCIGSVIATSMGFKDNHDEVLDEGRRGSLETSDQNSMSGNGLRDVWVLGEGFFRGLGLSFDLDEHQVGLRQY